MNGSRGSTVRSTCGGEGRATGDCDSAMNSGRTLERIKPRKTPAPQPTTRPYTKARPSAPIVSVIGASLAVSESDRTIPAGQWDAPRTASSAPAAASAVLASVERATGQAQPVGPGAP